jgi:E3 ubiquitin-protein ligase UBR7
MTSLTESMVHWLQEYEAMGKRKREEALARAEGAGSDFMQTLGHVQQIELLHGLNDMASELKSFLAPFGESGKTVTSADIHEFFEDFNQKRRRRN